MSEIDSLEIRISANANAAFDSIKKLTAGVNGLAKSLKFDTSGFEKLASLNGDSIRSVGEGVKSFAAGMQALKDVRTKDFDALAKGVERLSALPTGNIEAVGKALKPLADSVNALSGVNFDPTGLANFTTSISRLGNKAVTNAVQNLPPISAQLQNFVRQMNNIGTVSFDTAGLANLVSSITRLGSRMASGAVANLSPISAQLQNLIRQLNNIGSLSFDMTNLTALVAAISKLGGKGVTNAIINLPLLEKALMSLFSTLSRAPQISNNTIQMTQALANLAAQGGRVGTASRSIVGGINNASKAMKNARGNVLNFAAAFGKLYATWWAAIRGIKGWMASVEGTTDYIESFNYATVAFGKIASEFDENWKNYGSDGARNYSNAFIKGINEMSSKLSGLKIDFSPDFSEGLLSESGLKNLGLNIQEVTQYAAQLASVTNSIGLTGKTSLAASTAFTKLAGDISSLFNMKYADAAQNIQSGLIGQSRAMYKYGIDITNATLATYAYNMGIEKEISKMTQAEKMQLRMIAILNQSRVSWGDLSNTINSPNNMLKQFTNNVRELSMVFGQLFIPILSKVMPVINGVVIAIKRLVVSVASLLGIKLDFSSFGAGYNQLEDGLDDIADGYDNVAEAADKARTHTLGIDELNIVEPQTGNKGGAGADGGGGFDLTDEILKATAEYDKVWQEAFDNMQNKAQEWADKVETALEPVKKIFEDLFNGNFRQAGEKFGNLLNGFISPTTFGNFGEKVAQGINNAVQFALGMGRTFDFVNLGNSLAEAANKFFKKLDAKSLAEAISVWVRGALKTVNTFFKKTDFYMIGEKIGEFLKNLQWEQILLDVGQAIWNALNAAIKTWAGMLSVAPLETALVTLIAFPTLLKAITSSELITGLANLANGFYLVTTGLGGNLTSIQKLTDLYPALGGAVSVVKQAFAEFVSGLNTGGLFEGLQQGTQTISNSLNGIQKATITAVAGFAEWYIVSDAVENLAVGTGNLIAEIAKIAGAVTAAGIALSMVFPFPTGAIAAGVLGVVAAITGLNEGFKNRTEIETYGTKVDELTTKFKNSRDEIEKRVAAINDYVDNTGAAEIRHAEDLKTKYFELAEKQNKSNAEYDLMRGYAAQLVEIFPELNGYINNETGLLSAQEGIIQNLIDKQKEYYRVQAAKDKIIELYQQQFNMEEQLAEQTEKVKIANEELNKALEDEARINADYWENAGIKRGEESIALQNARQNVVDLNSELQKSIDTYNDIGQSIDRMSQIAAEGTAKMNAAGQAGGEGYVGGIADAINSKYHYLYEPVQGVADKVNAKFKTAGNDGADGYAKGFEEKISVIENATKTCMEAGITAAKTAQDSHSPSEVYKSLGKDAVDGYNLGIKENTESSIAAITEWATQISTAMKTALETKWSELQTWWTETALVTWWTENVEPWFAEEKWSATLENVKTSFKTKWEEIRKWWAETAMVQWWDRHVAPWFTKEKWRETLDNVKKAFETKWEGIRKWWAETAMVQWWDKHVAPWFTKEKWTETFENIQKALKGKWEEIRKWWAETAIVTWWNKHVAPWFTKEKWETSMDGIVNAFKAVFKNAANAAIDIFNKLIGWINEKMNFSWDAVVVAGKTLLEAGSVQLFTIPKIPQLATGGIIMEDTIFRAGEYGRREAILPLENRSAMEMIAASLIEGGFGAGASDDLIREQNELLREQNRLLIEIAEKELIIGDEQIVTAYRRGNERWGYNFG